MLPDLFTASTAIISWAADEVVVVVAVTVAREVTTLVIAVLQLRGMVVWRCEGSAPRLVCQAGKRGEQERGLSFAEGKISFYFSLDHRFAARRKKSMHCCVVKRALVLFTLSLSAFVVLIYCSKSKYNNYLNNME